MKRLQRLSPPACLDNANAEALAQKAGYYTDLRDTRQRIRDRWNTIDSDSDGVSAIRRRLLDMSGYECAYCGRSLTPPDTDVDHYLPSSGFELLAYCWENYLPSCKLCNQHRKKAF